jgi:hypothetical protein
MGEGVKGRMGEWVKLRRSTAPYFKPAFNTLIFYSMAYDHPDQKLNSYLQ